MQKKKDNSENHPYLLVLACSARKREVSDAVPAWHLYDGVMYRVVKKLEREGKMPKHIDILILSAK